MPNLGPTVMAGSSTDTTASNINVQISADHSDHESEAFMTDFNIKRFTKKDQ